MKFTDLSWVKPSCIHRSLVIKKSILQRHVVQNSPKTTWSHRAIHHLLPTVLGPPHLNFRTWAHIITGRVKIRLRRHSSQHLASVALTSLSYLTCFGIVPPSVDARWGNVAGGGLVHTIIWQSSHYRSISHILRSSTTCQLMLSASFWTLGPNTSLAWGSTPAVTHQSEMPQTLQIVLKWSDRIAAWNRRGTHPLE